MTLMWLAESATSSKARSRSATALPRIRSVRTWMTGTGLRSGSCSSLWNGRRSGLPWEPVLLYGARMADPEDKPNPHTVADHYLAADLAHVHDGDADHDHD